MAGGAVDAAPPPSWPSIEKPPRFATSRFSDHTLLAPNCGRVKRHGFHFGNIDVDHASKLCKGMRVLGLAGIGPYIDRLGEDGAAASIRAWVAETKEASWRNAKDLRTRFPNVEMQAADRVVFRLEEGRHVVAANINFGCKVLVIRFVGSAIVFSKVAESVWQASS